MTKVFFILREGFTGLGRAKLATAGAVITIMLSLLFVGFFYVISSTTSHMLSSVREKVEMEAFLSEPLSLQRKDEIEKRILALEGIEHLQFVSKDEAAKFFKEEFGEDVKSVLNYNPLPASFKIYLKDEYRTTDRADSIQRHIGLLKGIEKVTYRRDVLGFIERQSQTLSLVGLAFGILIGVSAMFLVANTIRLTVYAKRQAIESLKRVGATLWSIRAPFIIEGIVQGMMGGILAAAIMYELLTQASGSVSQDLSVFLQVDPSLYGGLVVTGAILGFVGSALSVRSILDQKIEP